jgi:hypothetical protein
MKTLNKIKVKLLHLNITNGSTLEGRLNGYKVYKRMIEIQREY